MLEDRIRLFRKIEKLRKRPLVCYVTSPRVGAGGQISGDAVPEVLSQLQTLPVDTKTLDLLLVSNGGDVTAAGRIVSLIRERVENFAVLIPQAAFSAATLIALGADEIIMHCNGNLGPTDPQIITPQKKTADGSQHLQLQFGAEDLAAFLKFAKKDVGLTDQSHLLEVFKAFCQEVGAVPIGVAARSSQLILTMGEKLLELHMKDKQQAHAISQQLGTSFFHHGYALSRSEARKIGLPVAKSSPPIEELMWSIWLDFEKELDFRDPFNPIHVLKNNPSTAALFGPVQHIQIPAGIPPQLLPQVVAQALALSTVAVPPVPYKITHALMESTRHASRCISEGNIFGARMPDLQVKINILQDMVKWVALPVSGRRGTPTPPAGPVMPVAPTVPPAPIVPGTPAAPATPITPTAPTAPVAPAAPVAAAAPVAPAAPATPVKPLQPPQIKPSVPHKEPLKPRGKSGSLPAARKGKKETRPIARRRR
ncbi:MAG: hypothetical protein WC712_14080 [Candidatus Brocadiia bacterium]